MVDVTRRRMTGLMLGGVVVGMGGMAYAAVPLYRVFCHYPEALRPAFGRLREKLQDPDPCE